MSRHPAPHTVRTLASRLLPDEDLPDGGLPGGSGDVRPVDEGGEHSTWWVGTAHVLRLAPDAEVSARLRREIALRAALRPRLTAPVPRSAACATWADGLVCTLDVRLPGVSAEHREVSAEGEEDLAQLLAELGGFTAAEASALGVPTAPARHLAVLRRGAVRAARTLEEDGCFDGRLLGLLETDPPAASTGPRPHGLAPAVLVHSDLKGEHLLVDGAGRVSGVLDWTDAVFGDPAEDIAGLALSLGAPAAVRIGTAAGYAPELSARGLQLARCDTLVRLADRLRGIDDSPLPLLRAQLARSWRATSMDRSAD
ncbi:aminoglycoside phosphotransferase family protein [Streptomyces iconiensis]|uniref:Aminoglycoside phosphotransferase family protein n=1 Tax=Streptomyces iconiensis TaxID=1384038 RepID=A0ABT6ZUH9_9ACTN|nr:aminoglycoside phosphotransferase family protein [Streptomyces iconiensis]MDJ1132721.1 aminoglycoside phosphotransferase family protein [Streptomyces iconiensis]